MRDGAYVARLPTALDGSHDAPTMYFQERSDAESLYPYVARGASTVSPAEISFPFADPTCLVRVSRTNVEQMSVDGLAARLAGSIADVCRAS